MLGNDVLKVQTCDDLIVIKCGKILLNEKSSWTFFPKGIPMMLNCFVIDKYDQLHGFVMYDVMWAIGRVFRENDYSFQLSDLSALIFLWPGLTIIAPNILMIKP